MSIKFVSHQEFPEDQYTKELVYLLIDNKYRVAYVRKQAKNGGQFWGVPSVMVTKDGTKNYYECFLQDSSFLEKDIKKYLEDRPWANQQAIVEPTTPTMNYNEEIPF
jgi:hypothetical protein